MIEYERHWQLSDFVRSMTTRIDRNGTAYAQEVASRLGSPVRGHDTATEQALLDSLNHRVEDVLTHYEPPSTRRRGDSLVFRHIYTAHDTPEARDAATDPTTMLLTALLAAEVETRGPLRLSRIQSAQLAAHYECIGAALVASGLTAHAILAFRGASSLHGQHGDVEEQDRCGLAIARVRRRAHPPGPRRLPGWAADLLCGYGYRPFRLLLWIALLLVLFTFGLRASSDISLTTALHMSLINFLNPIGTGDLPEVHRPGQVLLTIESYIGIVSTSVFFALLVRLWFRL
ncbi:hypothetical protein OG225_27495 [Nocardia sp. NBC_01377]